VDKVFRFILDERLGLNGVAEIKVHPFFAGINWKKIREKPTPFKPEVFTPKILKMF
jgi:serine/threonine kinase 38